MKKILLILVLLIAVSCQQEEMEILTNEVIQEVFKEGGIPEPVKETKEEAVVKEEEQMLPDGSTWKCTTTRVSITEGTTDFPLFNPNASVIYPGSLLQGKTLQNATPSVIPVKRAGGTISIDIIDGSSQPSFFVEEVSKSAIVTAANNIISESTGTVPANFNFSSEQVFSKEQLSLSLGLNIESQFVTVASQLQFRQDKEYNRFIVKLNQSFYTLSFDIPTSLSELFSPEVSSSDLAQYVGPGNPATYISDVTYGRIYYMLIESSSSATEIDAALNVSFSSATVGGSVDMNVSSLKELSDLHIKVIALGGESKSTFATIGETNIGNLVSLLGESTDIKSGVPISYVVRSALNNEIVNTKLAAEYDKKECIPLSTPLGEPIIWFDASDLKVTDDKSCLDCTQSNGFLRYYGPNDSYAHDNHNGSDGTVVVKWRDLSKNQLHASSVINEPNSRPMLVSEAFDNKMPAVEFFRGYAAGKYFHHRLTYSGNIFVNTDYTIFTVISYKSKINVEWRDKNGHWGIRESMDNQYGYFLKGSGSEQFKSLTVGFQNKDLFRFSHKQYGLAIDQNNFKPSEDFMVVALRFSKSEGMAVYKNGVLIQEDKSFTKPLISNAGAMITAPYRGLGIQNSRIQIAEIIAYGTAATVAQIKQQTVLMQTKYGL